MPSKKGSAEVRKVDPARARVAASRMADAARAALKENKLDEAKKLVEDALSLVEDSPRLHIFQAKVLATMANEEGAKVAARNAYDWVYRKPERYNDYRAYLEKELADFPQVKEAFFARGQEYERERAEKAVEKAKAARAKGDLPSAMRCYLEALGTRFQDGPALSGVERILKENSDERGLRYLDSFRQGQLSRKDLITLVTPDEGAAGEQVPEPEELDLDKGPEKTLSDLVADVERELNGAGGGDAAAGPAQAVPKDFEAFRRKADRQIENDSRARIDLAIGYFEMGLIDVACEELRAVRESDERFVKARCLLGEFLLKTEKPLFALQAFQECLRDVRVDAEEEKTVRYSLAKTYVRLGDWPRALTEIEALERRDRNYRDLRFLKSQVQDALVAAQDSGSAKREK